MRASRLGSWFLGLGVFVGVLAALGMFIGFRPSQLPEALLDLAAYKLALVASLSLLGAGALFLRHGHQAELRRAASPAGLPPSQDAGGIAPPRPSGTAAAKTRESQATRPGDA